MVNRYHGLVADMAGGVGWRDLRRDGNRRARERDVEITNIHCIIVEGNFPWNLIVVETDADVYGIGEAFTGPAAEHIEFLRPGLVGQNPFDVDRLVEHMTQLFSGLGGTTRYAQAAVSDIETALLDAVGKFVDLPIYQLLGGKYRDEVRIYADCHAGEALSEASAVDPREAYAPEAYAEVGRTVVEEEFDALKFDLDMEIETLDTAIRRLSAPSIEHLTDIVEAVTDELDPSIDVAFDLHWNYAVDTATRIARAIEPYDVAWLEDPVPPSNPESHQRVTESTTTPILAGENLVRLVGFLPFLTRGALDLIAPDLQKCGGLREFQRIAAVAAAYDVTVAPHNISTPIGTIASVHACASVPNAIVLEWHAREIDWWDDLHTAENPLICDGAIEVPEGTGLGIDLDPDVVADHLALYIKTTSLMDSLPGNEAVNYEMVGIQSWFGVKPDIHESFLFSCSSVRYRRRKAADGATGSTSGARHSRVW